MQNNKRTSPYVTAAVGALITLVGGFFLSYNYIEAKKIVAYDYMANVFYNGREIVKKEEQQEILQGRVLCHHGYYQEGAQPSAECIGSGREMGSCRKKSGSLCNASQA